MVTRTVKRVSLSKKNLIRSMHRQNLYEGNAKNALQLWRHCFQQSQYSASIDEDLPSECIDVHCIAEVRMQKLINWSHSRQRKLSPTAKWYLQYHVLQETDNEEETA
ncbi:hypothetical protein ACSBR1_018640 [Camellia fascicularis]